MTKDEQAEFDAYREQQAREEVYMYAEWIAELEGERLKEQREDGLDAEWNSRDEVYDEWVRNKLDEESAAVRRDAEERGF